MTNWKDELTEEHLVAIAQRYDAEHRTIVKVGGFENLVYAFTRNGIHCILRVSHSSHRHEQQIQAELDWITYLIERGVNVSKPLPSINGRLFETIESASGHFIVSVFERARGEPVNAEHPEWGPALFAQWGYVTGLMHDRAKSYDPPAGAPKRKTFNDVLDDAYQIADSSPEEQFIYHRFRDIEQQIAGLRKSNESYGLCHRDLHHGNFFVHHGQITVFDFDDCGYDYYVQDLAMAVYYASIFQKAGSPITNLEQATEFGNRFLFHFMTGYERANRPDPYWIKQLPLFIEKRRLELCMILYQVWGSEHANAEQREWLRSNVEGVKNDIPCMRIDI